MKLSLALLPTLLACSRLISACSDCEGTEDVILTRHVRRMQPDARNTTSGPKGPLEWGQINFLHTTDTHGWLEGHVKEQNYGADWGDFISFARVMKQKARSFGVDLLLIDTGDLHDGAGLSDATSRNGLLSNPIFEQVDYDLLTIGNHELYVTDIAYEHFNQFAKIYGERYLTSNVEIINPATGKFEYIGQQYRYFTTEQGLNIMAFGVLYDFTGNSNVSRITTAANMTKQSWFSSALNDSRPVDLYLLIGHNPVRSNVSSSTIGTIYQAIRKVRPDTPIQIFGGHTHVRDFFVYDNKATALESGRYCETLGWLAIDGIPTGDYETSPVAQGVPNPTRSAVVMVTGTAAANLSLSKSASSLRYARRYLDWNRLTFEYHGNGSQSKTFDSQQGKSITGLITADRQQLNLSTLYGCAPQTWCQFCAPFGSSGNINTILAKALSATVINKTRADIPRLIIINTGSTRFDLVQGPFTFDDSFIVSPFTDAFEFIPDVPYQYASQVLGILNAGPFQKRKRELSTSDFNFGPMNFLADHDDCKNPPISHGGLSPRSATPRRIIRRQAVKSAGYTTVDDFGSDGDDTVHSTIPNYPQPNDLQANASFPATGTPQTVDLIFLDFIQSNVLSALKQAGKTYTASDISFYLPPSFTTNSYLPAYAKIAWQSGVPTCPVGAGVGS